MLPDFWQKLSYFNPIFHTTNALRQAMIGGTNSNMGMAMAIICLMFVTLTVINLVLLKKGVGLRE